MQAVPFAVVSRCSGLFGLLFSLTLLTATGIAQAQTRLYSWGLNSSLQLGSGNNTNRRVPGTVKAPPGSSVLPGVASIALGQSHTIAVKLDGTLFAWGYNANGQLGSNTTIHSSKPVQVLGTGAVGVLTNVFSAAAGASHTIVLKSDGTLWTFGSNGWGQLGDNTFNQRNTPVQVHGLNDVGFLTGVAGVAAGGNHNVVVKTDGTVYAWGINTQGHLGDNTADSFRDVPIQVRGANNVGFLTDVAKVACGNNHSLALKTEGTVWTWGQNTQGPLGDNTTTRRLTPVQVLGPDGVGFLTDVVAIAAGDQHSLAVKSDGTVWTWGINAAGQLGDSTNTRRLTPVQVHGPGNVGFLTGIVAVGAGDDHCLAVKSDGTVWTWGNNNIGQLGNNVSGNRTTPVQVVGLNGFGFFSNAITVDGGIVHSAALKSDGTVWSWGWNQYGQLGNDTTTTSNTPVPAIAPEATDIFPDAKAVVAGQAHTVVLRSDGTVYAFGQNTFGQLGDGTTTNRSVAVQTLGPGGVGFLTNIIAVSAGNTHTIALRDDGTIWAWGSNNGGKLGDNTQTQRTAPVQVHGLNNVGFLIDIVAIAAGGGHTLALRKDGSVFGWGLNNLGQLGTGTSIGTFTPLPMLASNGVGSLRNIVALAAGNNHTLALGANGAVYACGANTNGQLGNNTTTHRNLPVRVLGVGGIGSLNSMVSISAGENHSVALYFDGTVFSWGGNTAGQLGNNTTTESLTPVQVIGTGGTGFLTDVATVTTSQSFNLAVKFDGTVWSWGNNGQGQLGDDTNTNRPAPVQVLGPDGVGFLTNIIAVAAGHNHSIAISAEGGIQGSVILQNSACSGIPIHFEFRPVNGSPFTRTIIAGPLGQFTFTDIPPGEYDIAVKGSKWLRRTIHVNTTNNNILNLRIFLLTGDADDNNIVDVEDLSLFIASFDAGPADSNWLDGVADFNCDEIVDVNDLDLYIQNFDLAGDE